jgi:hypothetical protein
MKREYDFTGTEHGRFCRKPVPLLPRQSAKARVVIDRDGYPILLLPEEFRINATEMRVSMYGKRAILVSIKKKRAPVQARRRSARDFRATVRTHARRDPAFRALIGRYVPLKWRKKKKKRAPKI